MNILVIDSSAPCNLLQGNSLIGYHLFRRLGHHRLTLVCPAPPEDIPELTGKLKDIFETVHLIPRRRKVPTLAGVVEPALARASIGRDVKAIRTFQDSVRRIAADGVFDIIHTRLLPMAPYVYDIPHPRKLIELVDSETLRTERRAVGGSPLQWPRAVVARVLEAGAVTRFDAATTVSDADSARIRAIAPSVPVRTIPNGVDADRFAPLDVPEDPETLVFTGAMSFPPNVSAMLHFHRNILPLIREEIRQVRVVIAGRDPAQEIAQLASDPYITVTGYVEDIRNVIARNALFICPMVTGSGIKNKVLEAMAMARPIVSTKLGTEALNVVDGQDMRIADTPSDFARAVVQLLRDPGQRSRLGRAARKRVLTEYTWDSCAAAYEALYAALAYRTAEGVKC